MKTKNKKPVLEYKTLDPKRPLSWSSISSFEWNKDQWWRKYIGGEIPEITPELKFGKEIDEKLQDDPTFLPQVVRYPVLQHEMRCTFADIPLIGIADAYRPPGKKLGPALRDYKTGRKAWDQNRADDTGQLTMYCFMLYTIERIRPEDLELWIDWMPTRYIDKEIHFVEPVHVYSFRTRRNMHQVLDFGQRIVEVYADMLEYCKRRPVLDTHSYDQW
jgi:hypothetical protein